MPKSSRPKDKKKPSSKSIHVDGSVSDSVLIAGDKNKVTIQFEQIKTTYGLFTIPPPVTDFTGRDAELARLKASFTNGAIITGLSGAGGIGKTELARKLAQDIAENYPDARMNMELQGTSEKPTSSEDAMRRLLEPFLPAGQKLPDDETQLKGLYQQTFAGKKALLLLDNAVNAVQVRPLIPPAPSAAIITSRQHFSLTEFGLHEPLRLDVLSPEKAREFLRGASPKLNASSDEEVEKLAKLCGYLPLALRVAASLLNDRPDWMINTLLLRLQDEHTRLKHLKRDADLGLDVESTISLSYQLLDDDLKKYFRILAVFTAPFPNFVANIIWGFRDENENECDEIIGKLVNRSLLNIQVDNGKNISYLMHDLIRLFATNKLLENDNEAQDAISRHAEYWLYYARGIIQYYLDGKEGAMGYGSFAFLWPHLYTAYERFLPENKTFPRPEIADRWLSEFPVACAKLLDLYLLPSQILPLFINSLAASRRLGDKDYEGSCLVNLGATYASMGDTKKAIEIYQDVLNSSHVIEEKSLIGTILGNLGSVYQEMGKIDQAIEYQERAVVIMRETGDRRGEGMVLTNLGSAYGTLGDTPKAIELFEKALFIAHERGDTISSDTSLLLNNLGTAYAISGDPQKAIACHEQALIINGKLSFRKGEYMSLGNLGNDHANIGDTEKSIVYYEQKLIIADEIGDRQDEGETLEKLASAYANMEEKEIAISCIEDAIAIFESIGAAHNAEEARQKLGQLRGSAHQFVGSYDIPLTELIHGSILAGRNLISDRMHYFYLASRMRRNPNASGQLKTLAKLLQNTILGKEPSDLSALQENLAKLVRNEIEKQPR